MSSTTSGSPGSAVRRPSGSRDATAVDPHLLQCLFDESPDGIALTGPDMRYVEANARFCEIVGRTREQLLSMTIADLVVPEELEHLTAAASSLLEGGSYRTEWRIRHDDGHEILIEVTGRMLSQGYWVAFIRDVSTQRRDEDARRRAAEASDAERRWLQAVLDTVPLGMLVFEPGGRLAFNERAEQMLGMTLDPDAGSAQYRNRILHRDGTPMTPEQLLSTRVLRHGETIIGVEGLIEQPDGSRAPILGSAAPILDANGAVIGGVGVFQDIGERLRDQEAIRANERLLDGIFELLPVGVWIADRTGHIVRTNPAGLRIWAGTRYVGLSEFGQYRAWWADSGEQLAAEDWALARALTKGETTLGELLRIQAFDDTFKTVINSSMPLYDEQGRFAGAIVVNEDVTRLFEVQDALRRALESRDEMLRVVSHDLRGPLQSIVMTAQLVKIQTASSPEAHAIHASLDRILRVGRNMARMVDDLLDLTAIEEGRLRVEPATVEPALLLHELADMHEAQAESLGIALAVRSGKAASPITADRGRLLQALSNLVGNALKFVPAGGSVTLSVDDHDHDHVRFSVVDSGPGIDGEHLPRVFDPFWQARSADHRGRGLGLAIAKGIIEAHGGRIWIESEVGRGTTVCFTMPRAASPASPSGPSP